MNWFYAMLFSLLWYINLFRTKAEKNITGETETVCPMP